MKIWTLLLIGLIASGCASNGQVSVPDWTVAEREDVEVTYPVELPTLCRIPSTGTWSVECWGVFEQYEEIAHGNYAIAANSAEALRKTEAAYDSLVSAGKYQQQLAIYREELLQEERKQRTYEKWFYRMSLVGLVAIGVATQ